MANSIQSLDSTSSYFGTYSLAQLGAFAKQTVLDAIPGSLAFSAFVTTSLHYLVPSLLFNDDLQDPDSEDFIVTAANKGMIAQKIIERRVVFDPSVSMDAISSHVNSLHSTFVTILEERMEKIAVLAQHMGIARPVQYVISLSTQPSHIPYSCVGDTFSLGDPLIKASVAQMRITNTLSHQSSSSASNAKARQDFILAHEMVHIAKHDILTRLVCLVAMAALNFKIWYSGFSMAAPITTFVTTAAAALVIHAITRLFYTALVRRQELTADLMAMNALGTSEGAETFFSSGVDNPSDLEHPSSSERLEHARAWKKPV